MEFDQVYLSGVLRVANHKMIFKIAGLDVDANFVSLRFQLYVLLELYCWP
jgi:hypothetical protein